MSLNSIVIAGAGQAGYQTAASLRQGGFEGSITLVGDEPGLPYQRPPLSKAYLQGSLPATALRFRQPDYYDTQRITRLNDRVTAIDRAGRNVSLASGGSLAYDHLVLALGARNRVPAVPGIELAGVLGLRTLADADALAQHLGQVKQVVVIGAGFIGLEFAAVAAAKGIAVQVIEMADRPMARAITPTMSAVFTAAHQAAGVQLHFGQSLARLIGQDGRVCAVECASGLRLDADLVVYGIGVLPNTELASQAGLEISNGVLVDADLLTSDPAISAIGDVACFTSPYAARSIRLESVQNAADQARAVANRLTGKPAAPYTTLPWFWTDQGELKLQIAGLSEGHDEQVLLGDPLTRQMSVLCYAQGRLIAVETVNRPADHMAARKILAREQRPSVAQASEAGFDLKAYELTTRPPAAQAAT